MPWSSKRLISRNAVSLEHLASLAYLDVERLPSKPSSSRLITLRCLSFTGDWLLIRSHVFAFRRTFDRPSSEPATARPRQPKNHSNHEVISTPTFWLCSRFR